MNMFRNFIRNQDGATAIEYALIGSLVSIVIMVTLVLAGDSLVGIYNTIATAVSDAV